MGLDIHPGGASWSYGGFARFRESLADEEGFSLDSMEGYTEDGISWGAFPTTLTALLHHSDCDGYLEPWECSDMIDRLRAIHDSWLYASSPADSVGNYDTENLGHLISGMEHCIEHGCTMRFG